MVAFMADNMSDEVIACVVRFLLHVPNRHQVCPVVLLAGFIIFYLLILVSWTEPNLT